MNELQAALGISQLAKLDSIVHKRNIILKRYLELFEGLPVYFLKIPKNVLSSVHLAVLNLNIPSEELHLEIFNNLRKNKIGVQVHYTPIHLQPFYKNLGFKKGDFPNSELYAQNAISLPVFPKLSYLQQLKIVNLISNTIN